MSIPEIFNEVGESGFREIESKVLADLGKQSNLVIATGGGCVTRTENYRSLHQNGRILWIERDVSSLPTEGRPLSHRGRLNEMYRIRRSLYEAFADARYQNNTSVQDIIDTILASEEFQ